MKSLILNSMLGALVIFTAQSFANSDAAAAGEYSCSAKGYELTVFDDNYTYYSEAKLKQPDGKVIDLGCAMFLGLKNSKLNCSDESETIDIIIFDGDNGPYAKLYKGPHNKEEPELLLRMKCKEWGN